MKKSKIKAEEVVKQNGCEIELRNGDTRIFVKVFFDPDSIWIDVTALPFSAYLCARHDAEPLIESECGEDGERITRQFLNIDWAIDEWGGNQETVDALIFQKYNIMNDLPRLKEKYTK